MRFNPKASIDSSRVGDAGSGGGGGFGGGPMRIPMPGGAKSGGGIGMLLVIVLVFVLSQCMGGNGLPGGIPSPEQQSGGAPSAERMGDSDRYANCDTGADANNDEDCARLLVENSLYNYWSSEFANSNLEFTPAQMITFTGGVQTGCGSATSQVGPFYCPGDQTIYLDSTFFPEVLEGQLGGQGGDFVEPYVIGHEYGHHIQNVLGFMGKVKTQKGPNSDAVRLELQADCFAGVWTKHASTTTDKDGVTIFEALDEADIQEALDSAKTVGDDRIQQKTQGRVSPDGWTHGSSEQRMNWFMTGYQSGDPDKCNTFEATEL